MRLAEFVFEMLSSDDGVTALLTTSEGVVPIHPGRLPERESGKRFIPAISFKRIDVVRDYDYNDTQPWAQARVEVNCWGHTYDDADELGDAVLAVLSGYVAPDDVQTSDAINDLDTYEPDSKLFRRILDFRLSFEEVLAES